MASRIDQSAEPRLPLSRERVLEAAIRLADAHGVEALTMRRLGHELGVEAMSLYNHIANKDDILNGIVEMVFSEVTLPPDDGDWKAAIRASAISGHQVLLRHPWAYSVAMSQAGVSPARIRWSEGLLRRLREAGFSAEMTCHAFHALTSHVEGFTLWVANLPAVGEELKDLAASFLREFPVDDYPYMAEHIQQHIRPSNPDDKSTFAFGLDLILDGLERMRDTA